MNKAKKKEKMFWKKYIDEFVKELKTADYWFKNDGKPNPEWKLFETRAAARNAARNAAWDAARNAAWDAAWDAARGATRGAAWDAAWDAAWGAARDAARDATWGVARGAARGVVRGAARGAARDAARDATCFCSLFVCMDLDINFKHFEHMNKRMEVWRKGYGLLCDVDGVLYVYKKL